MSSRGFVLAPGVQSFSERAGKKLDFDTCVKIACKMLDAGLIGTDLEIPFVENEIRVEIGKPRH